MRHVTYVVIGVSVSLAACQREPRAAPNATAEDSAAVNQHIPDSLRLSMAVPPRVRVDERVPITLTVENISGRALELYLTGRDVTADVVVRDAAGNIVWHKLERVAVPAILQLKPLAAGESITLHELWDPATTAPPGEYVVSAELLAENRLQFPPSRLQIFP